MARRLDMEGPQSPTHLGDPPSAPPPRVTDLEKILRSTLYWQSKDPRVVESIIANPWSNIKEWMSSDIYLAFAKTT